jgi:exodeoxyribonuclease V gamma subunit
VIRICTSHRTEVLLDAFVASLTAERKRQGPFAPVRVIVPNRNVEAYLRLKVCEQCGIAANLQTRFLRRFLADIAEAATPGTRVADAAYVEGCLLALLHDPVLLEQPDFAHVRRYLDAADGDRDALDRRRCQLAGQLAQLFEEYAGSRPEMLSAWAAGRGTTTGPSAVWQRALWLAVFGPSGRLAQRDATALPRYQSLEVLWSQAMAQRPPPLAGQAVHVFGLSYVARAYHRMMAELGRMADVFFYTLGPCAETSGELASTRDDGSEDPFGLSEEPELARRLWARPGRESLRLWAELPGTIVHTHFPSDEHEPTTVLHRLQAQIVGGEPASQTDLCAPDDTLRVLPCPSLRRELEVVAAEIWSMARKDPSLRLCDVAVIVPEASKDLYLTQLSAVFEQSSDLPHNVADLAATAGHRALQAIGLLVDLPFSSMSRKEVLPLLTHPSVMARFPEATPAMWSGLAARLGIVRGVDRSDFDPHYPERDLFSWDQGLRRLALGAFADAADPDALGPVLLGAECYLPGPPIATDDSTCLGFGLLARSLIADARFAWRRERPPERPLRQWLDFMAGMVESYLVLGDDDASGRAAVAEFVRRLHDLADIGLGDQPVSYRIAAELAKRELAALPWSRGRYLAGGVTVASFVPMRAIPFRAVFVLGLGQGAFPRPAGRNELDLRQGNRRAGDVDRREQDLYMFLETLLSARDQVVLSYVARDEVTGEELPASSVLSELRSVLGQGVLGATAIDALFCKQKACRPPLRRHDDSPERRQVLPAAEAEYRARALGQIVRPAPYDPAPIAESVAALPEGARAALGRVLVLPAVPKQEDRPGALAIPLATLRRFLEDPLQGSARFRLGLRDDEDDGLSDVEDEPFDWENRDRTGLLTATMTEALRGAKAAPSWDAVRAAFRRQALAAELAGQLPTGIFGEAAIRRQEEALAVWQRELAGLLGRTRMEFSAVRLSPHADASPRQDSTGAVVFQPSPRVTAGTADKPMEIRITGQTSSLVRQAEAGAMSLAFTWRADVDEQALGREELRAFLDYVVLTATGAQLWRDSHRSALFFRSGKQTGVRICDFAPLERARAMDYLTGLCRELVDDSRYANGLHPYLLPHEAVFKSQKRGTDVVKEIERLCENADRSGFSSLRGPVPDVLARYAAPSTTEAARMVNSRFGLFFALARPAPEGEP